MKHLSKALAILLAFVICFSAVPMIAAAENPDPVQTGANNGPSNGYAYIIASLVKGDGYPIKIFSVDDGIHQSYGDKLVYDGATNTLTVKNLDAYALDINEMGEDFKIVVKGYNTLSYITVWGYGWGGSAYITGDGVLDLDTDLLLEAESSASVLTIDKDVTLYAHSGGVYVNDSTVNTPIVIKGRELSGGTAGHPNTKAVTLLQDYNHDPLWADTVYLYHNATKPFSDVSYLKDVEYFAVSNGFTANETRKEDGKKLACYKFAVKELVEKDGEYYIGSHAGCEYAWEDSLLYKMYANDLDSMRISDINPDYVEMELGKKDEHCTVVLASDGSRLTDVAIVPASSDALSRPQITTGSIPDATEGKAYTAQVAARPANTGGRIVGYTLKGTASKYLSIDAAGRLTGKFPTYGIYQAIVIATEEANGKRVESPYKAFTIKADIPDHVVLFAETIDNGCSHSLTVTDGSGKTVKTVYLGDRELTPATVVDMGDLRPGTYTATLTGAFSGREIIYNGGSEQFTVTDGQNTRVTLHPDTEIAYPETSVQLTVDGFSATKTLHTVLATVTLSSGRTIKREITRQKTVIPNCLDEGETVKHVSLTAVDDAGQVFEIASSDNTALSVADNFTDYRIYCSASGVSDIRLNLNGSDFSVENRKSYTLRTLTDSDSLTFVRAEYSDSFIQKYDLSVAPTLSWYYDSIDLDFSALKQTASVSGYACDDEDEPVDGAAITCSQTVNGNLITVSAVTDSDGHFQIDHLYTGTDASLVFRKTGYTSASMTLPDLQEDTVCSQIMSYLGCVTVTSPEYLYRPKLVWSGADDGSLSPADGYRFALPFPKTVNGKLSVTVTASNILKTTGTVTVKNGVGELTLNPVLKGSIDWSGAENHPSYTGYSVKITGTDFSRLFAAQNSGCIDVAPGEYTVSILKPDSNAAYATQKLTVSSGKPAYVTAKLPEEAKPQGVSSGKLTGPATAANGKTYQLKGLLTSIDGKDVDYLRFQIGNTYSWNNNIQHVVINGKKAMIENGCVYRDSNPEIDWSLPLNFTVYCTQRATADNPVQTVSAYVDAGSETLIGSVVTRYVPELTLRTVRAVSSQTDTSQRVIPDAVSFVGKSAANTEIRLYDNGSLCAAVMTDQSGNYSGNLMLADSSCYHTIRAEADFGGRTVSAESTCTYRAGSAVLQSLNMNGNPIPINGSMKAYTALPTGSVQFSAKFKNAEMLDDITMNIKGEDVTSKVFFKVRNISGYELLPATADKTGSVFVSEQYFHGADYPTGVQTIYMNKEKDYSYSVNFEDDLTSTGKANEESLASTGAFSSTFQNSVKRIDQYDKDNYPSAYDYDSWLKDVAGDSGVLTNSSLSAAQKSSEMFKLYAAKLNKNWGKDRASAITAKKAAERCPSGEINIRTYVDAPKWDVTAQNLQLRKDELEDKGYESWYYMDKTSGREMCVFTGSFYYDKDARPVDDLLVTNIYNGVPTVEENKRMFDNGKPLGSTLDVTYICDITGKKWIRSQCAVMPPNAASPIHTFSTQVPSKREQPNEYKENAISPVSLAATGSGSEAPAATGDPLMSDLANGNNIVIQLNEVKPKSYSGLVLGLSSFCLGMGMNAGFISTPTILSPQYLEKIKLIHPKTGEILEKLDYGSVIAALDFKAAGDIAGEVMTGSERPRQKASDFNYWQDYLTDRMKYYAHVEEVTSKTNDSNNGGRIGDYRADAVLAGYMKNRTAEMQRSFTELQAATEKVVDHFDRNENMTYWLSWGSMGIAMLPKYGVYGAAAADGISFCANASTDTHVARYNKALENFRAKLEEYNKLDMDTDDSFRHSDEIVERNRDKYPRTKTIQQLLDEAGYGSDRPRIPDNPDADDDPDNTEGEGGSGNDCDLEPVHDPSGVVYEAVLSNPVPGAQVTLYRYRDAQDPLSIWDDSDYLSQQNPLTTDENGFFRWDVPEGEWYVAAAKEGYVTGSSQNDRAATVTHGDRRYLPVLPPQLDVNIPLVSYAAPAVASAQAKPDGVYITFTKYMDESTLKAENFSLTDASDNAVAFKLEKLDSEQAPANINYGSTAPSYTRTVRLTASLNSGTSLKLKTADTLRSYAGVSMNAPYYNTLTVEKKTSLAAPVFSAEAGEVEKGTLVTITCAEDAEIIYTTDGTPPAKDHGTRAKSGVQLSLIMDTTLKAIAVNAVSGDSEIVTAAYTVAGIRLPESALTPKLQLGDVDGDGDVTIVDATMIQRFLASLPTSSYHEEVADTDGDGEITIIDATMIQRFLAGLEHPEGIGKPIA